MNPVKFFFEYRNEQRIILPVNPEEVEIEIPGNNEKVSLVSLGDINILKLPSLLSVAINSFIPVVTGGSYIEEDAPFYYPQFYINFFQAVRRQKEPLTLIVTEFGIAHQMGIQQFNYKWSGGDRDMYYTLELEQYKPYGPRIIEPVLPSDPTEEISQLPTSPAPPVPPSPAEPPRENTPKKVAVGVTVKVNGQLHRDSYGSGPGQREVNATRKIHLIVEGRPFPYHVTTLEGGWRGWVEASAVEVIE